MKIMELAGVKLLIFAALYSPIWCQHEDSRDGKFSIFQIIKFENGPCKGGSRNGTCFTAAECESAGGKDDGSCADGFGVCCVTILSSGGSTSLNQSYVVESAPITGSYTICPCSEDVCRIRFDFTAFVLNAPEEGNTLGTPGGGVANSGQSMGDCLVDQFSITASSGSGTPIICGTNTGQHVILDSNGSGCSTVNIGIGSTTATRNLDIMVTQFKCGEEMGGPPGCLQFFTTPTGSVRSFNFPNQASGTAVASTVTHLSNQHYTACIRQPLGNTIICYTACTTVDATQTNGATNAATAQSSFGLSLSGDPAAKSVVGSNCNSDYITIPGGDAIANIIGANVGATIGSTRFCGRGLATDADAVAVGDLTSVCSNSVPFQIGVNFDEDEANAGAGDASDTEIDAPPGGIIGFCLDYTTA